MRKLWLWPATFLFVLVLMPFAMFIAWADMLADADGQGRQTRYPHV